MKYAHSIYVLSFIEITFSKFYGYILNKFKICAKFTRKFIIINNFIKIPIQILLINNQNF